MRERASGDHGRPSRAWTTRLQRLFGAGARRSFVAGLVAVLVVAGLSAAIVSLSDGGGSAQDQPNGTTSGGEMAAPPGVPDGDLDDVAAEAPPPRDGAAIGIGDEDGALPDLQAHGRTIIRSGELDLEVEAVDTAYHRVQLIARGAGGYVSDSTFTGADERQRATVTLRVPATRFTEALDDLRDLAVQVRSQSTSANDVTEEYTDLQSSLRNLRAVETQYLELLDRASEIADILQVQERLTGVRHQIEQIEGRTRLLDDLADLATITVSLYPAEDATPLVAGAPGGGITEATRAAWDASLRTLEAIATVGVTVIVFSWWIAPLLVAGVFVARRWLRHAGHVAPVDTP